MGWGKGAEVGAQRTEKQAEHTGTVFNGRLDLHERVARASVLHVDYDRAATDFHVDHLGGHARLDLLNGCADRLMQLVEIDPAEIVEEDRHVERCIIWRR